MTRPTKDELMHRSFLVNYQDYIQWQESPEDFHLWIALTLIGAMTQREVYYDMGYFKIFTNLYTTIVAESAICRKSSAMDIGMDILINAARDTLLEDSIVQGKISPKAILKVLQQSQTSNKGLIFIQSDEIGVFLGKDMLNLGLTDLLTTLYTCKDRHDYKMAESESIIIYNSFPCILAGGVPSYMRDNTGSAFKEGFIGRMSFVNSEEPRARIADIRRVADMPYLRILRETLVEQLHLIGFKSGEFQKTDHAYDIYESWYNAIPAVERKRSGITKTFISGYIGRKGIRADKLAMIYALSRDPLDEGVLTIDHKSMEAGIQCAEIAGNFINAIFKDMPGSDIFDGLKDIEKYFQNTKRITRTHIVAAFRRKLVLENINMIINSLIESNVIFEAQNEGRALIYYYVPEMFRDFPRDEMRNKTLAEYKAGLK